MRNLDYPDEVVTLILADAPEQTRLVVLRGVLAWCKRCCEEGYRVTTTRCGGEIANALAVQFESAADAARFAEAFSGRADGGRPDVRRGLSTTSV